MEQMIVDAFLKILPPFRFDNRHYSLQNRVGDENPRILRVVMVKPPSALPPEPHLEVRFNNNEINYIPFSLVKDGHCEIVDYPTN